MINVKDFETEYMSIEDEKRKIDERETELYDNILNYTFPQGKYKDKQIRDIIITPEGSRYITWWFKQNNVTNYNRLVLKAKLMLDCQKSAKRRTEEEEYERSRRQYCKNHNINYDIDYGVRHNINMRDFGM